MFEPSDIPMDHRDATGQVMRTCGTCLVDKEAVTEFYKDGKDSSGNDRYRRDCKECYRVTRLSSRRAKRLPPPKPKPVRRKRK